MKHLTKLLILLALLLLAGCPGKEEDETADEQPATSSATAPLEEGDLAEASLFNIEGLEGIIPFTVALDRKGEKIFSQYKLPGSGALVSSAFGFQDDGMSLVAGISSLPDVTRPYLDAHPFDTECLAIGNYQTEDNKVNDRVYVVGDQPPTAIPFERAEGIPETRPFDDFYGLKPFYSWDGRAVIVPLKFTGVVVCDLQDSTCKYVDYPPFIESSTGKSLHALPDQNGKRRIFASIWNVGLYEGTDECRLYTLDLNSLEWQEVAQLTWIVYQAGGPDLDNEPWLIAGSRGKRDTTERERKPIFGLLDPASGVTEILRSFGEILWQIEVDPYGEHVLFLDRQREALVRLNPATGQLDYDPRWFNEDARIIAAEGGDAVLLWLRNVLLKAEWSGHESQEGFLGGSADSGR